MLLKKMFLVMCLVMLVGAGVAIADDDNGSASGFGGFAIGVEARNGAGSWDHSHAPFHTGLAIGGGLAGGTSEAGALGFIMGGTTEAEVSSTGGGITGTTAFKDFDFRGSHREVRVGSRTEQWADVSGSVKVGVEVEPGNFGMGFSGGAFHGAAGQISANASYLVSGPALNSNGFTGGIAGQGSGGVVSGSAHAEVFGYASEDRYSGSRCRNGKCEGYWEQKNSGKIEWKRMPENQEGWNYLGTRKRPGRDVKAGAGAGAGVAQYGWSYSESFRAIDKFEGGRTESMGTFVGAGTEVDSFAYAYDWDKGCFANSNANVSSQWVAGGAAVTFTIQGGNGNGIAKAGAIGIYKGSGSGNSTFIGSANGYSQTSITTLNGYNGSINSASAGMKVTAVAGGNNPQ